MTDDSDYHAAKQLVGMRFANVEVPPNADIRDAYVEFRAKKGDKNDAFLEISVQASDNAATFLEEPWNLSLRPKVEPTFQWTVGEWKDQSVYRTPNLSTALRAMVAMQGWAAGNSVVVMVEGTGRRKAVSYDGNSKDAPALHVIYIDGPLSRLNSGGRIPES
ncbi:MAG: hypothetical protein MUF54_06765 [Polyangiaceae bacterium]|jgi:hypothetical protein|nr:hypothetical protein [Polyangiaceae bacterium]